MRKIAVLGLWAGGERCTWEYGRARFMEWIKLHRGHFGKGYHDHLACIIYISFGDKSSISRELEFCMLKLSRPKISHDIPKVRISGPVK